MESLQQLIDLLARNPWLVILGFIVTVASLVWGIISHFKGKRVRIPCYAIRSNNLVRQLTARIPSLEILFSGQQIENLTSTKVVFWNEGQETVRREDVASSEPISFQARHNCKILDARVVYAKNTANRFVVNLTKDQLQAVLDFEYVDMGEGAVVQLLHTGQTDDDIEVRGIIKGAGKLVRKPPVVITDTSKRKSRGVSFRWRAALSELLPVVVFYGILGLMLGSILLAGKLGGGILQVIVGIAWTVAFGVFVFRFRRERKLPKGFDAFRDEL